MPAIGIDLGTTNSAVAILRGRPVIIEDSQGSRTLPSAVGWDPDEKKLVIGTEAKNSPHLYGTKQSVKRFMGTDQRIAVGPYTWTPAEWSAEVLKALKRQVEEKTGEPVTDAVITVPAYFQLASKDATKEAGRLAGLNVLQLLEEPSAAVMAYGPKQDERILVYDLGGGTFDVAIVDCFAGTLKTLAVFGNNNLGGDDFDKRIVEHLLRLIKQEQGVTLDLEHDFEAAVKLKKAAELAKIALSTRGKTEITIAKITSSQGRAFGLETVLRVEEFNNLIRDLVEGTLVEVEKALQHAKLPKSKIDTILLVGGSTYLPLVQQTVKQFFGKDPNRSVNPDLAVAIGAAASIVEPDSDGHRRHVVTVGFVPEASPNDTFELEGRTTPNSRVRVSGGDQAVETTADDYGTYLLDVPLRRGSNSLVITATSPGGETATLEAEPILQDPKAEEHELPPAPPAPRLSRALSIAHSLGMGAGKRLDDAATVIIPGQTDLPKVKRIDDQYVTGVDDQRELVVRILEGDLPLNFLNTGLGEVRLQLPPNVPEGERVIITFTVDENSVLTAEVECTNRTGKAVINLKSSSDQKHIFQQMEDLFTQYGNRIRPEERADLEQSRMALEDLADQVRKLKESRGGDGDALSNAYQRFRLQAEDLRRKIDGTRGKYA